MAEFYAGHITKKTRNHMFLIAGLFDLVSFLLVLTGVGMVIAPVINLFAVMLFWLWFAIRGLGWPGGLRMGLSEAIEFIPLIQAVPQNILMVGWMYTKYKVGDISHLAAGLAEKEAARAANDTLAGGFREGVMAGERAPVPPQVGAATATSGSKQSINESALFEGGGGYVRAKDLPAKRPGEVPPEVAGPSRVRAYKQRAKDYAGSLSMEGAKTYAKEQAQVEGARKGIEIVSPRERAENDEYSENNHSLDALPRAA